LRLILALYTGVPPSQLSFTRNQFGKPALDGYFRDIRFRLSQSGDLSVYAVARRRDLGVDLELLEQKPLKIQNIAESFLPEREIDVLNDTPADQKEEMFLRLWTQLEAQGKARGIGIGKLQITFGIERLESLSWQMFQFHQAGSEPWLRRGGSSTRAATVLYKDSRNTHPAECGSR